MPFRSEKQKRWMFANEPEIAKKWAKESKGKTGGRKTKSKTRRGK